MRIPIILFFLLIQVKAFSQIYEKREAITQEFSQTNPEIRLNKITSDSTIFAEIEMKSNYLERQKITPEIIGFRVSGSDERGDTLYVSEMIYQNSIPQIVIDKLKDHPRCTHLHIDRVTIKWFNGNFTTKSTENWKLPQ